MPRVPELGVKPLPRFVTVPSFDLDSATSKASESDSVAGKGVANLAEQRVRLFTRQRSQVRYLSRPPGKTPSPRPRPARLPEDLPEDHPWCSRKHSQCRSV